MSDIKEIRILPMSNSDVASPTYDDAIDFLLNKLITQNNCRFYFKSKFNFIGKTLILFQYEGKLIGKGIFIDISEESNGEYSGYYLVDKDSIQVFNKNIYINDLNEYVPVNKFSQAKQKLDLSYLDKINEMIEYYTTDLFEDNYQIWSMNISKKENYEESWELFKQNSCISIDYWIKDQSVDYSAFKNLTEIKEYLKNILPENSVEPSFINRFVNNVKKGDIIISHKGGTVVSGIGVIESDYIHQEGSLNNIRKVNWIYIADNLKIKDKNFFRTYNIVKLNEDYSYFVNEIIARIAGKDKNIRGKLLNFIFNNYNSNFYSKKLGKNHFSRYALGESKIKEDWNVINQKITNHEEWDNIFWKKLFHEDLELFSVGGNSLRGIIKSKLQKKLGDCPDKYLNNIALEFINVVNTLLNTSDVEEQRKILNDYGNEDYKSYGIQTGVMSPILFYLNKNAFYPINNKTLNSVRLFSLMLDDEVRLSNNLIDYADSNEKYKKFIKDLNNEIDAFDLNDIRIFDECTHWICDSKLGNYANKDAKSVEIFPIKEIFENVKKPVFNSSLKRNLIYFGAPGTGKSYNLNKDKFELLKDYGEDNYERVTFHPDYTYANFVGTYKPVPENDTITYKYVPGPFMRVLKKSLENPSQPFLLLIEEINRANAAAVFGDVFQLLDRENYESIYPINVSEDMKYYIPCDIIKIPKNMFIWATMNSADQGVFPMDTAFKRRWDFKYFSINNGNNLIENTRTILNNKEIHWDKLRRLINDELLSYKINEDKLIGPFFAFNEYQNEIVPENAFKEIFKNKIIMYLFEDAARSRRNDLFSGAKGNSNYVTYSQICELFDEKGLEIFCDNIKLEFMSDDE